MKNKFAITLVGTLLLAAVLGCGMNPFKDKPKAGNIPGSNKSLTDKGVDTVVGEETTGVPECDEVFDLIAQETNNPDDGYIVKATKALFLNKIKESIKKSIDESKNKNGTADIAKTCVEYKKQIIKYKEEEQKKKNQ